MFVHLFSKECVYLHTYLLRNVYICTFFIQEYVYLHTFLLRNVYIYTFFAETEILKPQNILTGLV